jgi:glutamine amidotransferase
MERSIQQIKEFCEVCQTEQFCRGFTTLNYSLTDGETVIMTRYCDKTPHIPPPSLYFAFGLTKEIHKIIGDGGRSGTNDGPGDGSATPVLTKAENNRRIEEAMKKEEPIDEHQESTLCQSFLDEWEGKPTDDCALVVASDPLTFCENRWFPVPSNSILWCDKGGLPKMRKLEGC